jgi:hypothetical protein
MSDILISVALGGGLGYAAVNSYFDAREGDAALAVWSALVAALLLAGCIANLVQS